MATLQQDGPSAFRAPSGWIPVVLALAAIALLAGYLVTGPHEPNIVIENGVARQDETAAWSQMPSAITQKIPNRI